MRKHAEEVTDINFISNTQYVVCVSPNTARKKIDLVMCLYINIEKKDNTLMYVCPCIIYEIDERYQLDATIYLLL